MALDRAADAGHEGTALRLLELGADPGAGRGVEYVLARAGPRLRSQLVLRGGSTFTASTVAGIVAADVGTTGAFEDFRRRMDCLDENSALGALEERLSGRDAALRPVELVLLLEDAARAGYRPELLRRICTELRAAGMNLGWGEDAAAPGCGAAGSLLYGRRPLDAALQAAVEEGADERTALFLLEEGFQDTVGSPSRLNTGPLLRSAAAKCRPRVVEELLDHGGADPDATDPRFGGTALDRAVSAGCWGAARRLLERGANPHAGRGLPYLLKRASPDIVKLLQCAPPPPAAAGQR